jgi:H+/gluconate symporter-like permease
VGPSLLVVLLFTLVILWHGFKHPLPKPPALPLAVKLRGLVDLVPTLILILVVLGTIYTGLATPTESAALGVVASIIAAAFARRLSWRMLHESAEATARTTAFIGLILCGAYLLNYIFGALGVPQALSKAVSDLPVPPWVASPAGLLITMAWASRWITSPCIYSICSGLSGSRSFTTGRAMAAGATGSASGHNRLCPAAMREPGSTLEPSSRTAPVRAQRDTMLNDTSG